MLCCYEAFYLQSLAGTALAVLAMLSMGLAVMGTEIFPELVELLRSDDLDDNSIQRQGLDYQEATDYSIVNVILATTFLTAALAIGRGHKAQTDLALVSEGDFDEEVFSNFINDRLDSLTLEQAISSAENHTAVATRSQGPMVLTSGDTVIIPGIFVLFTTFSAITSMVS